MTELSPAAEAVLNAVTLKRYDVPYHACPASIDQIKADAAAVLWAVANLVLPEEPEPQWWEPVRPHFNRQCIRRRFLAIAAELEATRRV